MQGQCVGLFAKYWQPGNVKTRLATSLGPEPSADIYRLFVQSMLTRLQSIADDRVLAFAPGDQAESFAAIRPRVWRQESQSAGDLGLRMKNFFANRFAEGFERVVLLGTDSPNVPLEYVTQALAELETHDVVLGPTEDGGYYLVGARRSIPPLFEGIPWSTPKVWEATTARLQAAPCNFAVLSRWYDVDEVTDYQRLLAELVDSNDRELEKLYCRLSEVSAKV